MRILITGGLGFIGSHTCDRLLTDGHEISIVDNLDAFYSPLEKLANLRYLESRGPVTWYQLDVADATQLVPLVATLKPKAIIHLAAWPGVMHSTECPIACERANILGTRSVLEACGAAGIDKLVFASSSLVYDPSGESPVSETTPTNHVASVYAATKLSGERLSFVYSQLHGLSVVCLRLFSVYGPRMRPDLPIRKFTESVDDGRPVHVFGDGSSARDFTYIDDAVSGIVAALQHDCRYEVFNIGSSSPVDLLSLIRMIELGLDRPAEIVWSPTKATDVRVLFADISKAKRLLAYAPRTKVDEGIARFIGWHRSGRTHVPSEPALHILRRSNMS